MSSNEELLKELAAMRAHFDLCFDQLMIGIKLGASQQKQERKVEAKQLKEEIMAEMNRRMDAMAELVAQGAQRQQDLVGGGGGKGQANQVDDAAGEEVQEDADHQNVQQDGNHRQDLVSGSKEKQIVVKEEEVTEDPGTGGQQPQPEEQALFQPVAGPSGMCRAALKRPQTDPPRRSPRLGTSECPLILSDSSGDEEETESADEEETDSPPTKKARITATSKLYDRHRCPHCSKIFTHLAPHLLTHTGERPHVCDLCQKAFARKANLIAHRRSHTGERPYICSYDNCGRAFAQKSSLNVHLLRHLEEMSHHCEQCEKRFNSSEELTIHRLTHSHK